MAITDKYGLSTFEWGLTGWTALLDSNNTLIDTHLHTYLPLTAGESIAQYDAVCVKSDGKVYKAKADRILQPCIGFAIEAKDADQTIRIQRVGEITNASWSFSEIGKVVYLSRTVAGGVTQNAPTLMGAAQTLGIATSATTINLEIAYCDIRPLTTTSSTASTTSSSSSSSSSSTTSTTA